MNAQSRTMLALVRRELWEHRAFWMVPAIMSALFTLLLMRLGIEVLTEMPIEKIERINAKVAQPGVLDSFADQTRVAAMAFSGAGLAIGSVLMFVGFFYLLDSLYGDRRDRSILFWRSMPVTDVQTVLSKIATLVVAAPLLAVGVLTAAFVVWGSIAAGFGLVAGFDLWWLGLNPVAWVTAALQILAIVAGGALITAPFIGWLTLASAWAPRAPFLWAVVPIAAVAILEGMVFDTSRFIEGLGEHLARLVPKMFDEQFEGFGIRGDAHETLRIAGGIDLSGAYLLEPQLWAGIVIGAALVYLAIRVRRIRDDATY